MTTHDNAPPPPDWRPEPHPYGPHRDEDAPQTVTVRGPGKHPKEEERPVPDAVLRLRRQINDIAHGELLPSNTLSSSMSNYRGPVCPDPAVEPQLQPSGKRSTPPHAEPERTHVRST